jgi:hypothetical protein
MFSERRLDGGSEEEMYGIQVLGNKTERRWLKI